MVGICKCLTISPLFWTLLKNYKMLLLLRAWGSLQKTPHVWSYSFHTWWPSVSRNIHEFCHLKYLFPISSIQKPLKRWRCWRRIQDTWTVDTSGSSASAASAESKVNPRRVRAAWLWRRRLTELLPPSSHQSAVQEHSIVITVFAGKHLHV